MHSDEISAAMTRRVLVCIEDTGVAHVVAARLMKDGIHGVVVDKPKQLADEAKRGADAVAVQDKYPSGDVGASLLRQVRVARGGEPVPAIYLLTAELAPPDRHVLEKQYRVQEFLKVETSPLKIAAALQGAAGASVKAKAKSGTGDDDEVVLHEDEEKNDFDISIESNGSGLTASEVQALLGDDFSDDDDDPLLKTVEVSGADLAALRGSMPGAAASGPGGPAAKAFHDEHTLGNPPGGSGGPGASLSPPGALAPVTQEGEKDAQILENMTLEGLFDESNSDLSHLPAPGGDADVMFDLQPQPTLRADVSGLAAAGERKNGTLRQNGDVDIVELDAEDVVKEPAAVPAPLPLAAASAAPGSAPPGSAPPGPASSAAATSSPVPVSALSSPSPAAPLQASADEDPVQIQELQKAQQELKKALLAERRAREGAQKRVEELEGKLSKLGEPRGMPSGQGVPQEGVFEDVRYPALLARCRSDAFTGAVHFQVGGTMRTVYLRDGLPVGYSTNEPGEKIGKVLVAQGRITDEQYVKAATRMIERGIKLTEALVELGLIDAEALQVEQRNLTRDQIIMGFELVQGRFTVTPGQTAEAAVPTFDFGPGEIYVQGFRRYAPPTEMMAFYESQRDKYLIANARLASYRPKLGLGGDDERLIRLLGEALTVEEAIDRASVSPEAAARLLAALQALELVEEWQPGVEQFRNRLRAERQKHVEELATARTEASKREERLFEAFERALAKLGAGSADVSLSAQLGGGPHGAGSEGRRLDAAESGGAPNKKTMQMTGGGGGFGGASLGGGGGLSSAPTMTGTPLGQGISGGSGSVGLGGGGASPFGGGGLSGGAGMGGSAGLGGGGGFGGAGLGGNAGMGGAGASSGLGGGSAGLGGLGGSAAKPAAKPEATGNGAGSAQSSRGPVSPPVQAAAPPAPPKSPFQMPPAPGPGEELSLADLKFREGIEQASSNRLDEAEVTLREAVRLDASKPEYLVTLARVLLANPRYERAGTLPVVRSLLDRAVQIAPDNHEASDLHAQVVREMG